MGQPKLVWQLKPQILGLKLGTPSLIMGKSFGFGDINIESKNISISADIGC